MPITHNFKDLYVVGCLFGIPLGFACLITHDYTYDSLDHDIWNQPPTKQKHMLGFILE